MRKEGCMHVLLGTWYLTMNIDLGISRVSRFSRGWHIGLFVSLKAASWSRNKGLVIKQDIHQRTNLRTSALSATVERHVMLITLVVLRVQTF